MRQEPKSPYLKGRRLRLFGGPNGSGKSTIFNLVNKNYDIGYYINADEIELELKSEGSLNLSRFGIHLHDPLKFKAFLDHHPLTTKAKDSGYDISIEAEPKRIITDINAQLSYEAALLADFIRIQLIKRGAKLTFESVMSHSSKVDTLISAQELGYKTYLYFICTGSPEINIERVNLRVKKGGHAVDHKKIYDRYHKSLTLLAQAVSNTYRSFIWDNSGKRPELIMEIENGYKVTIRTNRIPAWVRRYLLGDFPSF